MEVAGGGGIHQDGPGNVAAVLLLRLFLAGKADQVYVDDEILEEGFPHPGVQVGPQAFNQPVPVVVRVVDDLVKRRPLAGEQVVLVEFVRPAEQVGQGLVRVLVQIEMCIRDSPRSSGKVKPSKTPSIL